MSKQTATKKPTIWITGIKLESEPIDVSGPEVNPGWLFVDAAGNEHRWQKDADGNWCLPTLEVHSTPTQIWDEIPEAWRPDEIIEYFAPATGERINPGMRYVKRFVRSHTEATIEFESDGVPPKGNIRLADCIITTTPQNRDMKGIDGQFMVTEYKRIGPERWSGVGVCVGAPLMLKEVSG